MRVATSVKRFTAAGRAAGDVMLGKVMGLYTHAENLKIGYI